MIWAFFALAASFSWACEAIFDKVLRVRYLKDSLALTASIGIFSSAFAVFLFLVYGIPHIPLVYSVIALLAGLLVTPTLICYLKALSLEETSRVVPLWNIAPIFTLILAVVFLKEYLNFARYCGFALIILGGLLVSTTKLKGIFRLSKALPLMLGASLLFAVAAILLKTAYSHTSFFQIFPFLYAGTALGEISLFILPSVRKSFSASSRPVFFIFLFFTALTAIMGDFFNGNAYLTGPVSLITVFACFEGLFVLAIATFLSFKFPLFLKESIDNAAVATKILAVLLMALGLYFISA